MNDVIQFPKKKIKKLLLLTNESREEVLCAMKQEIKQKLLYRANKNNSYD